MHQITLTQSSINPPLETGTYVASNLATAEILFNNSDTCQVVFPTFFIKRLIPEADYNGRSILFCRQGSAGDLLFLSPAIREVKKRWPDCTIDVACFDRFRSVLAHNPSINAIIQNPVEVNAFLKYDAVIWLDDSLFIENERAKEVHAVDLVLEQIGLDTEDKTLTYVVTPEERAAAEARFPRGAKKRIGIQTKASSAARSWPADNVSQFIFHAVERGYEVVLLGAPREKIGDAPSSILDATTVDPALSFRESAALASTLDGLVAPDSVFAHLGGALGLPTVALYAAFDSKIRTSYAKSIFAINARVGCEFAPCSWHSHRPGKGELPDFCPGLPKKRCEAMYHIAADRVLALLERQMESICSNGVKA